MANKPQQYFVVDKIISGPMGIDEAKKAIASGSIDEEGEAKDPPLVICGKQMKYSTEVTFERPARKPRDPNAPKKEKPKAKK